MFVILGYNKLDHPVHIQGGPKKRYPSFIHC